MVDWLTSSHYYKSVSWLFRVGGGSKVGWLVVLGLEGMGRLLLGLGGMGR